MRDPPPDNELARRVKHLKRLEEVLAQFVLIGQLQTKVLDQHDAAIEHLKGETLALAVALKSIMIMVSERSGVDRRDVVAALEKAESVARKLNATTSAIELLRNLRKGIAPRED
jgi:hypothetical protein